MTEPDRILIDYGMSPRGQEFLNGDTVVASWVDFSKDDEVTWMGSSPWGTVSMSEPAEVPGANYGLVSVPVVSMTDGNQRIVDGRAAFRSEFTAGQYTIPPASTEAWPRWIHEWESWTEKGIDLRYQKRPWLRWVAQLRRRCFRERPCFRDWRLSWVAGAGARGFNLGPMYIARTDLASLFLLRIDLRDGVFFRVRCHGVAMFRGYLVAYINGSSPDGTSVAFPLMALSTDSLTGISGIPTEMLDIPEAPEPARVPGNRPRWWYREGRDYPDGDGVHAHFDRDVVWHFDHRVVVGRGFSSSRKTLLGDVTLIVPDLPNSTGVDGVTMWELRPEDQGTVHLPVCYFDLVQVPVNLTEERCYAAKDGVERFEDLFNAGVLCKDMPVSTSRWEDWIFGDLLIGEFLLDDEQIYRRIRYQRFDLRADTFARVRCHGIVRFQGHVVVFVNGYRDGEPWSLPLLAVSDEDFAGLSWVPEDRLEIPDA